MEKLLEDSSGLDTALPSIPSRARVAMPLLGGGTRPRLRQLRGASLNLDPVAASNRPPAGSVTFSGSFNHTCPNAEKEVKHVRHTATTKGRASCSCFAILLAPLSEKASALTPAGT